MDNHPVHDAHQTVLMPEDICMLMLITPPPTPRYRSGVLRSVCVCLSASIISGTTEPIFTKSAVAVARSSSDGVAIRYVLPVLWVTSRLAIVGRMAGTEFDVCECLVKNATKHHINQVAMWMYFAGRLHYFVIMNE